MDTIKNCSMCDKETGIVWLEELIYCGDCSCKKIGAIGIDMNGKFIYKQQQVEEVVECDRCGHEDVEWCMSDGCRDEEEEELDAWCYRCDKHFSADTEEGGDDGTEEEEWVCNSCFKDINNSSRIVEYN